MGRKPKVLVEDKLRAVEDCLSGKRGFLQICRDLHISQSSLQSWLRKYQINGRQGLQTSSDNAHYTKSVKFQAVSDYLKGNGSLREICREYSISSHGVLQGWIKKYNGHEEFKSHNTQGDNYMTKGRQATYEERTKIVAFCIENNYNYQLTSEQFNVSYQQVYSWVKKYKEHGYDALLDRGGKRKASEELSESEKLAAQLKLLEAENRRLKMENDFLKKLEDVERRR